MLLKTNQEALTFPKKFVFLKFLINRVILVSGESYIPISFNPKKKCHFRFLFSVKQAYWQ